MKYLTFYREDNIFEILKDPVIKKIIDLKISWTKHLLIGMEDEHEKMFSYITLKYGDDMRKSLCGDYTPIPGVDYLPKR